MLPFCCTAEGERVKRSSGEPAGGEESKVLLLLFLSLSLFSLHFLLSWLFGGRKSYILSNLSNVELVISSRFVHSI